MLIKIFRKTYGLYLREVARATFENFRQCIGLSVLLFLEIDLMILELKR